MKIKAREGGGGIEKKQKRVGGCWILYGVYYTIRNRQPATHSCGFGLKKAVSLMPLGTLLTILRLLHSRAGTVCASDILLFLCFGLYLAFVLLWAISASAE